MMFVIPETVEGWRSAGIPIIGSKKENILANKLYVLRGMVTIDAVEQGIFNGSFCLVQIRVRHYDGERIGQLALRNSIGNGAGTKLSGHLRKLHEAALSLEGRVGVYKSGAGSLTVDYLSTPGIEAVVKGMIVRYLSISNPQLFASYATQ